MAEYQTIPMRVYCDDCGTYYSDMDGHDDCPYHECSECPNKFHIEDDKCETGLCVDCRSEEPTDTMDIIKPIFKQFIK